MYITFTQPVPYFSTLWAYGSGESHPERLALDGLMEQSAKL